MNLLVIGRVALGLALSWVGMASLSADWPQYLGPTRDGVSPGGAPETWPPAGPQLLWKADVGSGFSGPVTHGDFVLLHHRQGDEEVLEAFDRKSGKSRWKAAQPTSYSDDFGFDNGPRGTPAVGGDFVYTFGAEGRLTAVSWADGKPAWTVPLGREHRADKGFFGFACSPLVVSNRVVLHLGGEDGAGIVAVDGKTGRLVWRSTPDEAGYASPILANLGGQQRLVCFTRAGVKVLDPADGRLLAGFPWRSRQGASVNAATPIVGPAGILVTSSYNTGAALLRWSGTSLERVWTDEEALSAHISTPVRRDGWYFGFHGRQEQGGSVRCFDGATGKMLWDSGRTGIGSVLLAGDRLVLMLESGELIQAEASGEGWKPLCRAQVLGSGVRAAPVLDGELFVARDRNRLFAYRIPRRAQ